jgi:hypothetical protein
MFLMVLVEMMPGTSCIVCKLAAANCHSRCLSSRQHYCILPGVVWFARMLRSLAAGSLLCIRYQAASVLVIGWWPTVNFGRDNQLISAAKHALLLVTRCVMVSRRHLKLTGMLMHLHDMQRPYFSNLVLRLHGVVCTSNSYAPASVAFILSNSAFSVRLMRHTL